MRDGLLRQKTVKLQSKSNSIYFYLGGFYVFSTYSAHSVEYEGTLYPTSEHAYQASKFHDAAVRQAICTARSAELAKELASASNPSGRRKDWPKTKLSVMQSILQAKAAQHQDVQQALRDSGNSEIVEKSPDDYFWGCGLDKSGQNHLGKLWMKIREQYS